MDWTIEVLNRNKHERQSFNCGEESLSTWLKNQASQSQDKGYAKTFVAVDPDAPGTILGYYSLSMFGAASDDFPAGRYPRIVPVAKLGRLAVALPAQRFGLGSELLIDALDRVRQISDNIGVAGVLVDAIDLRAANFYLKFAFVPMIDNPLKLFIPIKTIQKLFSI